MKTPVLIDPRDNLFYPLPPDYMGLTAAGKTQARVNACRQWLIQGTPGQAADRLVASTQFFDWYYLRPDLEAGFDPQFYEMEPTPTPALHWDMTRIWATSTLSIIIAPRGAAKTTHSQRDSLLRLISHDRYSVVYGTSTYDNAKHTGNVLRDQLFENARVIEDFGVLKPIRGTKSMGVDYMRLNNGSWVRCVSTESRIRGVRVRRFKLDDPESDAKASTSMEQVRANMERFLFSIVLPMVSRQQCGVDWLATFVSPRHFAYYAMQRVMTPDGLRALDPRFDMWHRFHIRAESVNAAGERVSCWPTMWPVSREQAIHLGVPKAVTLPEMEQRMGAAAYRREMLGEMTASEDSYFKLDIEPMGRHAWWLEEIDDLWGPAPRASSTLVCWMDPVTKVVSRVRASEWFSRVRLFATVDTAFTEKTTSDRRVCTMMGVDSGNRLFVLDMWSDRKGDDTLMKKSLEMADRWRCPVVFVEVVKESYKLYHRMDNAVRTRIVDSLNIGWNPAIRPLRPGTMTKSSKIATLDVRFEHSLIKLPLFLRASSPAITRLIAQVQGFDPDASQDGGLANDDEIDTVAMSLQAMRGRLRETPRAPEADDACDVIAALRRGETSINNVPLNVPFDLLPLDLTTELMSRQRPSFLEGSRV